MTIRPLTSNISNTGIDQKSLVDFLANLMDAVNSLRTVANDNKTLANLLQHRSQNFVVSVDPVLAINSNFDVKNTETTLFVAAGIPYTLADNTVCDTGTTKTLAASQWGCFAVEATNASTLSAVWASGDYASEALALAAAKAMTPSTGKCTIGFVTVRAHASGFTAGTDALTTGTGGNVATSTNYYSLSVPNFSAVSSSPAAADLVMTRS